MALSVDTRRILRAWVVAWEIDEGLYGVAYELGEGEHGSDVIGIKSEAERLISDIAEHRAEARLAVVRHDG